MWERGLDLFGLEWEQMARSCEKGEEPSGSTKYGELLD